MADRIYGWRCSKCGAISHIIRKDELGMSNTAHRAQLYKPELRELNDDCVETVCVCKWKIGRARKSKCRIEEAERRIGKLRALIDELGARCPHENLKLRTRICIRGGTISEKVCSICGETCGIN